MLHVMLEDLLMIGDQLRFDHVSNWLTVRLSGLCHVMSVSMMMHDCMYSVKMMMLTIDCWDVGIAPTI